MFFWGGRFMREIGTIRLARLQNEVGTKDFFEARIFSRTMLQIFPRNV